MSKRFALDGKVAVVTGAAGGIGQAIARSLAKRGCNVALADLNDEGLEQTARLIGNSVRVTRHKLDVANADAVAAFPAIVKTAHGHVDIVVNNAGVALGGRFDQLTEEEFDWVVGINFQGVVRMSRAFLPLLKEREQAQLVNLSSLFGIIAAPGQTAYAAAKFAVRGFSEALRNELLAEKSPVGVTVIHPGGVKTGIAQNARVAAAVTEAEKAVAQVRFAKALKMPADEAGEIIVRGIEQRRPRVLVGSDAKLASVVERIMPVGYWRLLGRMA
ncbi:SDR family NAD(P)-dependent oxidoreductase [Sphingomonas mollis]|uniref:SDR family NAD(P)-dependent oxidoreductase n=1 Tax=Sphingomonas mollis TaxID=2795726 RepID=A0ABS0XUM1_9SPHN|nr:SDR family NAD(P)-dependent oxidoreductase [Sphingomonas sp. BT553]MBJ6123736.1 SDR family NAD(P)-dependent oxidoreductase [Sphingomonas sp. BT553]